MEAEERNNNSSSETYRYPRTVKETSCNSKSNVVFLHLGQFVRNNLHSYAHCKRTHCAFQQYSAYEIITLHFHTRKPSIFSIEAHNTSLHYISRWRVGSLNSCLMVIVTVFGGVGWGENEKKGEIQMQKKRIHWLKSRNFHLSSTCNK